MIGSCQTIHDKDRLIEELIRYNVILKEEHSKMSDDKQDLIRNLDRITAQCEKMQLEKRQATKRYFSFDSLRLQSISPLFSQTTSTDSTKQELTSLRQQLESYQSRINQLESLLLRNLSPETGKPSRRAQRESSPSDRVREKPSKPSSSTSPVTDDESSKDSNMIDLTNVNERASSPSGFATTSSAIDILHSIIQQTSSSLDLPMTKKLKVRKLDDDTEENEDYLVRPLVANTKNFQRSFNKYGGHTIIPVTRRISQTSFKSKSKVNRSRNSSTKNNLKITTFFDLN